MSDKKIDAKFEKDKLLENENSKLWEQVQSLSAAISESLKPTSDLFIKRLLEAIKVPSDKHDLV